MNKISKKTSSLSKIEKFWLFKWHEPESFLTVIPRSKTQRLAQQAKLANIDAERAIQRAFQQELLRTKAISEAMFKSGKAVRYSLISSGRNAFLRLLVVQKKIKVWFS